MGRWTAPSDYDYAEECGDPVPRQERSEKPKRRSRPCEVCAAQSWFYETGPDGLERWQCSHGHVLIVQPGSPDRTRGAA